MGGGNLEGKVHLVKWDADKLWKQVITTKYGQEDYGWRSKKASGAAGVGVWKEIMKESDWDATIEEMWDQDSGQGDWNLVFVRDFNDWELDMVRSCFIL
ncbi:hypothetical protein CK203_102821 [Vitis vinifera]|uniref:Uncharacterized protein n=1 Tax=Vitis vinifera TaxID=29760 RepID=A0A438F7I8_VITVI|nr:hypothetical protein CK203_102821 [Vitis vinifera]